jgi:hypothetical protein
MRKLTDQERQLLERVASAGGSHCFRQEDNIPAAGHKTLRSLERCGYLTVEPTDDGPLVTLSAHGRSEADHG